MNRSDTIKEISGALLKAQMSIKAAIRESTNPHFKSKYADLSSVIEAVKEPLNKNGIIFIQPVSFDEHGVSVETVLLHLSGEWISGTLSIPVSKQDAQGVGSAISYGRRYGLQAMCGVPTEDDDGNAATASAPRPTTVPQDNWNALQPSEQAELTGLAEQVIQEIENYGGLKAMELLTSFNLDADRKVAIWSRFNSKERAAMEPYKRPKKAA